MLVLIFLAGIWAGVRFVADISVVERWSEAK